jgi:hypothetical protein
MTMNAPAPVASAAAPAPAAAPAERLTLDGRADALKARLSEPEPASEPAAETLEGAAPPASPTDQGDSSAAASDAGSDPMAAARAERMARLKAFQEAERQKDAERQAHRERKSREREQSSELEALRKKLSELEPLNDVFSDEAKLLAMAESKGMSAEKIIGWMKTRLSDPAAVAAREARSAEERAMARIKELEDKVAAAEQARKSAEEAAEAQREGIQRAHQFINIASASAETHPHVAGFLKRNGPAALIQFANEHVAKYLGDEFEPSDLHDHFETFLEAVAGGTIPATDAAASGTSLPTKKHGAEQPVTTLSGALASERTTVAEEVPLARLSLDERAERLKAMLSREH